LVDPEAGLYTCLLMVCSPALLISFRRIEFEPVLTAMCAAGSYQLARGIWDKQRFRCFLGGVLVGLGFAIKMWLIVPYAFAVIAFCVVEAAAVRSTGMSAGLRRSVMVGGIGFVLAASAHLLFVALTSPADLSVWVSSVYLGIFSGHGVTGAKLSALTAYTQKPRSVLYYPLILYRDHFYLLPLCLFGFGELLRVPQVRRSRLLAMIGGALVAVVALSVPAFKDARYVLPTAPFLYALAGLCVAALARSPDKLRPGTRSVVRATMVITAGAFLAVLIAYFVRSPVEISLAYLLAHALGTGLCLVLGELWIRTRSVTRKVAVLAGLGLLVFAVAYPRLVEQPPYAALAHVLAPHLRDSEPAAASFIARDSDVLQGYIQRFGLTYDDVSDAELAERNPNLKAFVFAPDQQTASERAWLLWLRDHAHDITSELVTELGTDPGYKVFVR
jgi:hypothetical protein